MKKYPIPLTTILLLVNITTIIIVISSTSYIATWASIELNIYSFIAISLIMSQNRTSVRPIRAALTYLLSQALGSILLLLAFIFITTLNPTYSPPTTILILAILLKLGARPFHFWLPPATAGLNSFILFWLLTIQKLPPLMLLHIVLTLYPESYFLLNFSIALSALIGGIIGLYQTRLQPLLAYSSISQLAWIIISAKSSFILIVGYFTAYTLVLYPIIRLIHQRFNLSLHTLPSPFPFSTREKSLIALSFINLAGIPPFLIFAFKFQIIIAYWYLPLERWLLIPLLIGLVIRTYYYAAFITTLLIPPQLTPKFTPYYSSNTRLILPLLAALAGPIILISWPTL